MQNGNFVARIARSNSSSKNYTKLITYFNIIALKRAVLTDCPFIIIQLPVVENINFQCQNFNFDVVN